MAPGGPFRSLTWALARSRTPFIRNLHMASSAPDPRELDAAARLRFAAFLERLADHVASDVEWQDAIVQHYADQLLENVRRECVRLLYNARDRARPGPEEPTQLRAWAAALRSSSSNNPAG